MSPDKSRYEKILEKADSKSATHRDWKGIAALISAILACAGFAWTKVEAIAEKAEQTGVQKATYEMMVVKVADLEDRLLNLERGSSAGSRTSTVPHSVSEDGLVDRVLKRLRSVEVEPEPPTAPIGVERRTAKPMPSFKTIQMRVLDGQPGS